MKLLSVVKPRTHPSLIFEKIVSYARRCRIVGYRENFEAKTYDSAIESLTDNGIEILLSDSNLDKLASTDKLTPAAAKYWQAVHDYRQDCDNFKLVLMARYSAFHENNIQFIPALLDQIKPDVTIIEDCYVNSFNHVILDTIMENLDGSNATRIVIAPYCKDVGLTMAPRSGDRAGVFPMGNRNFNYSRAMPFEEYFA